MTDVLEELTGDALSLAQIDARVDDWERRIWDLYALVAGWLPPGWTATSNRRTRMFEEPMREAGAPPHYLPVLDIVASGEIAATLYPEVLWIVGANGRLELWRGASRHFIVDMAPIFEPPQWWLLSSGYPRRQQPLERAPFLAALAPY